MKLRTKALAVTAVLAASAVFAPLPKGFLRPAVTASAVSMADFPSQYQYAADWIWQNRIQNEDSVGTKSKRYNTLFDQIIANKGQLNYVVRWHSMKTVTYEQRKSFESMVQNGIDQWTSWLAGYENWPYQKVKVNIVGWAVLDKSVMQDLHSDEVVWDNISEPEGDSSLVSKGVPSQIPCAPPELWTFNYFRDRSHVYNGQSFDMYLWATQNYGDYGGCGGDWGQRLSDNFYLSAASGSGFPHIYWHELGHGFGMTDFYGGEGASDGFPPGGFPGGENSIMMAGSASKVTDFDGWMLRYMWTKVAAENGRFDLANAAPEQPEVQETTAPVIPETPVQTTTTVTEQKVWYVNTEGKQKIALEATGAPWAAVEGQYGYWDNAKQEWVQKTFRYENSLGESGSAVIELDLGAANITDSLQIQVWYYAAWDNAAGDMVPLDQSGLNFTAYPIEDGGESTAPAETTQPASDGLRGDVDCNGAVNVADAVLLAQYCAEISGTVVSAQGLENAELDGSAGLNGDDVTCLLEMIAGLR